MKTAGLKLLISALVCLIMLGAVSALGEAFTALVTADTMTVYSESALTTAKGTVASGQHVTVISYSDGIAYVEYYGAYGYAKVSDMQKYAEAYGTAVVKSSSVKIYQKPNTSSKVLCTVKKGTSFVCIEANSSWVRLQNGDVIGYARTSGFTVTAKDASATATPTPTPSVTVTPSATASWAAKSANPATAVVTADSMTVRQGPTSSDTELGTLAKGTQFYVHTTNSGIAYIEYNGKFGFCRVSDYEVVKIAYNCATVTSTTLKIYASATTSSSVIYTAKKGAKFTVLDYNESWAKLQNGTNIGYAKLSGLSLSVVTVTATPTVTPTPTPTPTATAANTIPQTTSVPGFINTKVNQYKYTSTKLGTVATLTAGTEVTVLGWSGTWAYIKTSYGKGYCALKAITKYSDVTLSATTSLTATVNATTLKFYKYASTLTKCLGSLKKGTTVTILGYDDTWAYVSYSGNKGYCALKSLTIVQQPTLTESESVSSVVTKASKAYKYAISTSTVLGSIAANTEVTVLAHNGTWCLVKSGTTKGYVLAANLVTVSSVTMGTSVSYTAVVKAAASVTKYMYSGAKSLGTVSKGTTVTVLAYNDSWALIKKDSNQGYIATSNLTIYYDEFVSPTTANYDATVISSNVPLYAMALESSNKLSTLSMGTDVTVVAYTSKWSKVTVNGTTGYVLRTNISNATYTALKSGTSSGTAVTTMQKKLEDLGYFDGTPAGNYGSVTVAAVKRLQTALGMTVDGQASVSLLRVLYSGNCPESDIKSASLSRGSTGSNVTRLQTRLTYKGYLSASLDGDYGALTEAAVKLYQKTAGLTQTGAADSATMRSLFSSSAPKNTSSAISSGTTTAGTTGTASTGNYSTDADDDPAAGTASEKIETVIEYALAQLGKPYIYGTSGPNSYDCSGLTCYCFKKVGVTNLGRSAYAQGYGNVGTKISTLSEMKRGDIVCMNTLTDSDLSDHVGIYLGNGKFVHASSAAGKVIISSISSGYYNRVFSWGRRIIE